MTDPERIRSPRLLDRNFRWRGAEVSRIEAFTDAVFGIVLALLFLRAMPPETFGELRAAMKSLVPFAATFAIVGYIWVEHWLFSRRYDLQDGWTTFCNLVLLFLLLFYVYPLKFLFTLLAVAMFGPIGTQTMAKLTEGMGSELGTVELFVIYGVGYGAIFLVMGLMYARAYRLRARLALDAVETLLTWSAITQCAIQVGVATVSVVLATTGCIAHGLPGWVYCAIGPLLAVHGIREGRKVQKVLAAR